MAKLKITTLITNPDGSTVENDQYVSPTVINGTHFGGVGGNTNLPGRQLRIKFYDGSTLQNGYIIFQKGDRKFRVNTAANTGTTTVTLVNLQSQELSVANTATIVCNVATMAGANVANIGANISNNRTTAYVTWTAANVAGYATPVVGYQLTGTGITGNVTITAINSSTNVTVSCSSQTISSAQGTVTETLNLKNITNKFVTDWNNVKWRYRFSAPYTDGAGVLSTQPAWQGNTMIQVDSVN